MMHAHGWLRALSVLLFVVAVASTHPHPRPRHHPGGHHRVHKGWLPLYTNALGDALYEAVLVGRNSTDPLESVPYCCGKDAQLPPNPTGGEMLRKSMTAIVPKLAVKKARWHPGLVTLAFFDEVLSQGSVLLVGDSTVHRDIYELWASLNTHQHEPVEKHLLAAKLFTNQFDTERITSGAGHNEFTSHGTKVGTHIGYYGYYWADTDLADVWDAIFRRAAKDNFSTIVYNLGFHLLWNSNFGGWRNATSLARYEEHLAAVAARAVAANITLVLVGTNPLCSERFSRGPSGMPEYASDARTRSDTYVNALVGQMASMTVADRTNFQRELTWEQIMRLNLHTESGSIEMNRRMKGVAHRPPFQKSPYVWFFDRASILTKAACFLTPDGDGRHYQESALVTTTALLNVLHWIYAEQRVAGLRPLPAPNIRISWGHPHAVPMLGYIRSSVWPHF